MVCGVLFTTSLALGNRSLDLRITLVTLVLLPSGFFIGAHWGLVGLCSAWLVSVPLAYCYSVPPVLRKTGIRARDLLAECAAPVMAATVMYAVVSALRLALAGQPPMLCLLALSGLGALVYFAAMAAISRRHLVSAIGFARSLRSGT